MFMVIELYGNNLDLAILKWYVSIRKYCNKRVLEILEGCCWHLKFLNSFIHWKIAIRANTYSYLSWNKFMVSLRFLFVCEDCIVLNKSRTFRQNNGICRVWSTSLGLGLMLTGIFQSVTFGLGLIRSTVKCELQCTCWWHPATLWPELCIVPCVQAALGWAQVEKQYVTFPGFEHFQASRSQAHFCEFCSL